MRRVTALLAALALVFTVFPAAALAAPSASNTWIVTLRGGADPAASATSLVRAHGGEVRYVYTNALRGFAFHGSAAAAEAMRRNPLVTRIEADAKVWLNTTQTDATWGLDRIDQRTSSLDKSYTYDATGSGVTAYVIDSGIRPTHQEFGTRASTGKDLIGTNGGQDCNGHGTHVAGTIGGAMYGVAKAVKLVAVRVFDCEGGSSWSTIIAGVDWVTGDHKTGDPAVANMSLSGGGNSSVDDAVRTMIADGVATAVAAGNGNFIGRQDDACKYSPARVAEALTISATDKTDTKASWANYGSCVDWFAPGVGITSAWIDSDSDVHTISGTSMATPHTAGVAALYLEGNPSHTPQQVRDAIFASTTKDSVSSSSTENNDLLFSGFIGGSGGGGDAGGTAPTADFSGTPTTGTAPLTVQFTDASTGSPTTWSWDFDANGTADSIEQNPTFTYESAGTYTVRLTASNGTGADAEEKVGYIVVDPPPATGDGSTFGVSLTGSSTSQGNSWTATVTVIATDSAGDPVSGVTLTGDWSDGTTDVGCTTGAPNADGLATPGQCELSLAGIRKRTSSVQFTADAVRESTEKTWNGELPPPLTVLKP